MRSQLTTHVNKLQRGGKVLAKSQLLSLKSPFKVWLICQIVLSKKTPGICVAGGVVGVAFYSSQMNIDASEHSISIIMLSFKESIYKSLMTDLRFQWQWIIAWKWASACFQCVNALARYQIPWPQMLSSDQVQALCFESQVQKAWEQAGECMLNERDLWDIKYVEAIPLQSCLTNWETFHDHCSWNFK